MSSWRMAFMLTGQTECDAEFEEHFKPLIALLRKATPSDARLRIGVRRKPIDLGDDARASPGINGAIEATTAESRIQLLPEIAARWSELLEAVIDKAACIAVAGPVHHIVEPNDGEVFFSLTFRRAPNTSQTDFRAWWLRQHAPLATQLLSPDLLAYDQVHLDHETAHSLSARAGFPTNAFDAYDNLSWKDIAAYGRVLENEKALRLTYEDELGHVDHSTYKGSLLNLLHQS